MGAAQYRYRSLAAEIITQCIREQGCLRKRTDEHEIDALGQLGAQVFPAGIANQFYFVAFLLAPGGNYLRHNARQVGIHDFTP